MDNFATFRPIINNIHERLIKFYMDNNVERPDNKYFADYFNIPDYKRPDTEIPLSQYVYDPNQIWENAGVFDIPETKGSNTTVKPPYRTPAPAPVNPGLTVSIGVKDSIADRHNNPGNLMFANQKGATKGEPRGNGFWAKFENPVMGYWGTVNDIKSKQSGKTRTGLNGESTVADYIGTYAPPSENNTQNYLNLLEEEGFGRNTKLKNLNAESLADAIVFIESGTTVTRK